MVKVEYNESRNEIGFSFTGKLDTVTSQQAGEIIREKIADIIGQEPPEAMPGVHVVFDLQEVNYIASSFIRICVDMVKHAGTSGFSIVNCDPLIKKTFKIAGLDEILKIS
jgi:anti-anti-sigma factor